MNPDMGGGKKQIEHGVQVYNTLTGAKKKKKRRISIYHPGITQFLKIENH